MENLPSAFQHGDFVDFVISGENESYHGQHITACKIIGIHFFPGKVKYDLETTVGFSDDHKERYTTRFYNVDSSFIEPRDVNRGIKNSYHSDKIPFWSEKKMEEFAQFVQGEIREAFENGDHRPIKTDYFMKHFKKANWIKP